VLFYSFKGILFGNSLLASLLLLLHSDVKTGFGMFFLKLTPELFLDTSSIFFYLLLYSFFLNIFMLPGATGVFSLESLESFFTSMGGF